MKRTPRGFAIYTEFKDSRGQEVRVQRSSAMGPRRAWLFSMRGGAPASGLEHVDPYLSPAQARRLAAALLRFARGDE